MGKFIDISGQKFGRWTVVEKVKAGKGDTMWRCICDCNEKTDKMVSSYNLRKGISKSCGCLKDEMIKNGEMNRSHGKRGSKIYSVHRNMINRCYYEKADQYHNYGGRGITVCDEWQGRNGFINFNNWAMSN